MGRAQHHSAEPGGIPASAEQRLARFADLVALAISETEAREALQRRIVQQTAVNELSALALAGRGLGDLLDAAIGCVAEILDTSTAYVVEALDDGEAVARASPAAPRDTSACGFPPRPTP